MVKDWNKSHPAAIIPNKTKLVSEDEKNWVTPKGFKHMKDLEVIEARWNNGLTEWPVD